MTAPDASVSEERLALAGELCELILAPYATDEPPRIVPPLSDPFGEDEGVRAEEELDARERFGLAKERIRTARIEAYARAFDASELRELIAFNASTLGRRFAEATHVAGQTMMRATQAAIDAGTGEISAKAKDRARRRMLAWAKREGQTLPPGWDADFDEGPFSPPLP